MNLCRAEFSFTFEASIMTVADAQFSDILVFKSHLRNLPEI